MVSAKSTRNYDAKITSCVLLASLTAASGGFLFGYDIGITGGVTANDAFLKKFYPSVAKRKPESNYCKYNNKSLAFFTSSLYVGGMLGTAVALWSTQAWGRRRTIIISGSAFLAGAGLNAFAHNVPMLIVGRLLLGVGVGFGNQAVPIYLSEIAPPKFRGLLNMLFQLFTSIGILIANLVNYGTRHIETSGWRLSLGLAAVPAAFMLVGGLLLQETPNSLIERGLLEEGKATLQKIRGTMNVEEEYEDLVKASDTAKAVRDSCFNIIRLRSRPQLVMAFFIPAFQLLTGINSILFYAPILFQSLGFKANASLISSICTGVCMVAATSFSMWTVDKWGRRKLLTLGGAVMLAPQIAIGIILAVWYQGQAMLSSILSGLVVLLICVFVIGFGLSWGGLGWLIPSEIFPLETRSTGQSITVGVNLFCTLIIAQTFLAMLCKFTFNIFFFFGGWVLIMTIFVLLFLPETMNVAIEDMADVWRQHWFWKRIVPPKILDVESGKEMKEYTERAALPIAGEKDAMQ